MDKLPVQEAIYKIAQSMPRPPRPDPILAGAAAEAFGNLELNREIREEAKERAAPINERIYQDRVARMGQRPPGLREEVKREEPVPVPAPADPPVPEPEPDVQEEDAPLLNAAVQQIEQAHPPPPGANAERYRAFLRDAIQTGESLGRASQVIAQLTTNAVLYYHLWQEKDLGSLSAPPAPSADPTRTDDQKKLKPIEERIRDPVPPQCFRHIYKDERGQLRTIVICKTEGHGQRLYHDA